MTWTPETCRRCGEDLREHEYYDGECSKKSSCIRHLKQRIELLEGRLETLERGKSDD